MGQSGGLSLGVGWTVPRRRLDDADTIVKSSPVARTITDTVIDTIVSVAVSVFMPFYGKRGIFPNFAAHLWRLIPLCCGFGVYLK